MESFKSYLSRFKKAYRVTSYSHTNEFTINEVYDQKLFDKAQNDPLCNTIDEVIDQYGVTTVFDVFVAV